MKRLLFFAAAVYAVCFAVTFAADVEMGKANAKKSQAVKAQETYLRVQAKKKGMSVEQYQVWLRRPIKIRSDYAEFVQAEKEAKRRAELEKQTHLLQLQAALIAAQQQANAQAQAQQNAQQQALTNALLWQMLNRPPAYPAPLINPGPYNETIMHVGNQTWINGSGPYGPFNETIQHIGNETFVNGYGVPPGPWASGYGGGGFGGGY